MQKRKEILVFAKRYNKKHPEQIGGAIRLSEELIQALNKLEISISTIDINAANEGGFIKTFFKVLLKTILLVRKHDFIWFIGSNRVVAVLVPYILFIAKFFRKKVSLKLCGGNFDKFYVERNPIVKSQLRWVMSNVEITFFETKKLVNFFKNYGKTDWFPNVRDISTHKVTIKPYNKRFAFISQVKNSKGIVEILKAAQELDDSYCIHIYGPIVDLSVPDQLKNLFDTLYQGALKPEDVLSVLIKYDVIMLPTYYPGEGYPGILIESYALGKPVISTLWNSIPEIIEHEKTGLLIEPRNYKALVDAILWFDGNNYEPISNNALEYSKEFSSVYQTSRKLNIIKGHG